MYSCAFLYLFCIVVGVPYSSVQACAAAAVEDHCMVQSLGVYAVWLSSLSCAVSTVSWTPDS